MATFVETLNSVNTTKAEIDKCLTRCLNAPYPNTERKSKLDKLRDEANSNATPELEQKRAILKTLADIYLNFGDSAFVARRQKVRDSGVDVDAQIKRMKDVFEGMKPVLDAIGKVADKIKP